MVFLFYKELDPLSITRQNFNSINYGLVGAIDPLICCLAKRLDATYLWLIPVRDLSLFFIESIEVHHLRIYAPKY